MLSSTHTSARASAAALPVTLPAHQARRLTAPVRVRTRTGQLWITVDGQPEDILLGEGQSRRFESGAQVIVYALGGDAQYEATACDTAGAAGSGFASRFGARFTAWLRGAHPALGGRA